MDHYYVLVCSALLYLLTFTNKVLSEWADLPLTDILIAVCMKLNLCDKVKVEWWRAESQMDHVCLTLHFLKQKFVCSLFILWKLNAQTYLLILQEFHKEVENQLPLKNKVIAFGNQLLQNKDYDTRGLAKRLRDYEEEWTQLEKGSIAMQEYFVHAQMKLMPSRQALGELMVWTEELGQLVQQDATSRTRSMTDTQIMMKKYKVSFIYMLVLFFFRPWSNECFLDRFV